MTARTEERITTSIVRLYPARARRERRCVACALTIGALAAVGAYHLGRMLYLLMR